jgi:hypothetical protein
VQEDNVPPWTSLTAVELDVFTIVADYQDYDNAESMTLREFQKVTGLKRVNQRKHLLRNE